MAGWTKGAIEILMEEYRKHECLYVVKSPLYHNRNARRDAEAKIARALCEVRPNTDSGEVKAKINGLRTQFNNERNKVTKLKSGMSSDDVYRPSFVWYNRLMFLADQIMPRSSKSNLNMSQISEDGFIDSAVMDFEGSSIITMNDDVQLNDDGVLIVQESDIGTPASSTSSIINQPPQKEGKSSRKRNRTSPEDQVLATANQVLATMSTSTSDADEAFASYIASELKEIKNKRLKLLTKQKNTELAYRGSTRRNQLNRERNTIMK